MRIVLITTIGIDIKFLERFLWYYSTLGVNQIYLIHHQRNLIKIDNPLVDEIL